MKHTPLFSIRLLATALLIFASACLFSFVVAGRMAEGIWKQLGITQQDGADKIKRSFFDGYLHSEGLKNARNIAMADRATATTELLSYTKQYLASPVFKAAYEKMRSEFKPSQPSDNTRTKEQIRQDKLTGAQHAVTGTEALMPTLTAAQAKEMQPILELHRKEVKDYSDPNNPVIESLYQQQLDRRKKELEDHKKYTKEWEVRYPADYRLFVKSRIQQYLDLAATVDFTATVHDRNGKKIFDKQEYQSKSNDWKMIYRAGKEVYDAARPFLQSWMKELQ